MPAPAGDEERAVGHPDVDGLLAGDVVERDDAGGVAVELGDAAAERRSSARTRRAPGATRRRGTSRGPRRGFRAEGLAVRHRGVARVRVEHVPEARADEERSTSGRSRTPTITRTLPGWMPPSTCARPGPDAEAGCSGRAVVARGEVRAVGVRAVGVRRVCAGAALFVSLQTSCARGHREEVEHPADSPTQTPRVGLPGGGAASPPASRSPPLGLRASPRRSPAGRAGTRCPRRRSSARALARQVRRLAGDVVPDGHRERVLRVAGARDRDRPRRRTPAPSSAACRASRPLQGMTPPQPLPIALEVHAPPVAHRRALVLDDDARHRSRCRGTRRRPAAAC